MRILCIGDLHIKVDNIATIDCIEKQILTKCRGDIDFIVVLGDVLHTHERLHTLALNRAYKLFERLLSIAPLYVLVGNHDYIQNDQFLTDNHWMNALKEWNRLTVVDTVICNKEHSLIFVPYVPTGRFEEALNRAGQWKEAKYIFAHQEFEGAEMRNGITSTNGDLWDITYPKVISGHIHGRQTLKTGVHYVGAHSLSLITDKGIEHIPIYLPKKQTLSGLTVKELEDAALPKDLFSVQIQDNYDAFALFQKSAAYEELIERGVKVAFKPLVANEPIVAAKVQCFEKILYDAVLEQGNEYLYGALENIYNGVDLNEESILVVPLASGKSARDD